MCEKKCGHYGILEAATPYLIEAKGCVIDVTYPDGLLKKPKDATSIAENKEAIKYDEAELVLAGVRVNSVCGAPVTTLPRPNEMTDNDYQKRLQSSKKSHEKQAATAIAFLASDFGKLINRTALPVNPIFYF